RSISRLPHPSLGSHNAPGPADQAGCYSPSPRRAKSSRPELLHRALNRAVVGVDETVPPSRSPSKKFTAVNFCGCTTPVEDATPSHRHSGLNLVRRLTIRSNLDSVKRLKIWTG